MEILKLTDVNVDFCVKSILKSISKIKFWPIPQICLPFHLTKLGIVAIITILILSYLVEPVTISKLQFLKCFDPQ